MREDLLHFIWKYKKLQLEELTTSENEQLKVVDVGLHNLLTGPDFFNAKVKIDNQLWAGNVEIHVKSSDWFAHNHEQDSNYNNVILHVVWEDDAVVFRSDGSKIPTLELNQYIPASLLSNYQNLFSQQNKTFINCENDIAHIDDFQFKNWKERMFFERLEIKSKFIFDLLKKCNNDWEQVLFKLLLKNFGLKINSDAFLSLSTAIDFAIIKKLTIDINAFESVLYGMSHLLENNQIVDDYYKHLKMEYQYQKSKFNLENTGVLKPQFFKLRPSNFPTIRLSQLANLYVKENNLFSSVLHRNDLSEYYNLFNVKASDYWSNHFTFGKISKKSTKKLTKKFIDLLVINTILPLRFCYAKYKGKDINDLIIRIMSQIKNEENSIVFGYTHLRLDVKNAMDSQALLQLYNHYCTKNRCLQCAVGVELLKGNS
ncbi:DUF2851 family protein [Aurantibacter sp.]|uniref:DUF2851 family protein n=1 Tax=Aurantibacter sp. TaxID=2807103 RepID=UPI003262DB44